MKLGYTPLLVLLLLSPTSSSAEPTKKRRAAAAGAAIFPGALLHGAGQLSLGERRAGLALLGMEVGGVACMAVGGLPLARTNGSRYLIVPSGALVAVGVGLFALSWMGDVYSSAIDRRRAGRPEIDPPDHQLGVGLRWVDNPLFGHRAFAAVEADLRRRRLRLQPSAWIALDDDNWTARLLGAHRFYGPLAGGRARDGTRLDLATAVTHSSYSSDGFRTWTFEAAVAGRVDSERFSEPLRGSFLELALGYGGQRVSYSDSAAEPHWEDLLILRTGVGFYFGDPRRVGGEIVGYYDNRHDTYVGGLKLPGIAGEGVLGHVGAAGRLYFGGRWGVAGEASLGSARVYGLTLLHRN